MLQNIYLMVIEKERNKSEKAAFFYCRTLVQPLVAAEKKKDKE